jgi:predicted double-glycine peptidase
MIALAKQNHFAVKEDMKALNYLLETIEMKNAPVMITTIAARKSELQKELKAHPDRKEEIRQELQTLLALTEAMEKEDFEAGLASLGARKEHLMNLHKEF